MINTTKCRHFNVFADDTKVTWKNTTHRCQFNVF